MKNNNCNIKCDVNELFKVLSLDILIIYFGSTNNMQGLIIVMLLELFVIHMEPQDN